MNYWHECIAIWFGTWNILETRRFTFVEIKFFGSSMAEGTSFSIGIHSHGQKLRKSSSHAPLTGIHFKLTLNILGTWRFKFL